MLGSFLEELGELEVVMTKNHCIICMKLSTNKVFYKCKAFRRNLVMLLLFCLQYNTFF